MGPLQDEDSELAAALDEDFACWVEPSEVAQEEEEEEVHPVGVDDPPTKRARVDTCGRSSSAVSNLDSVTHDSRAAAAAATTSEAPDAGPGASSPSASAADSPAAATSSGRPPHAARPSSRAASRLDAPHNPTQAGARHTRRRQGDASSAPSCPSAPRCAGGDGGEEGALLALPSALLLRIFSFLSADDLGTAAGTCRELGALGAEDHLWRRLFCARWGKPVSSQSTSMSTWQVQYREQDAEEATAALSGLAEGMRDVFLEMQRAKRQRSLGRDMVDDLMPVSRGVADSVAAWRKAHGFRGDVSASGAVSWPRPDLSRRRHGFSFHAVGSTHWLCNETGWLHVCDGQCGERVVDPVTQMLVCPVSGTLTDRLMTEGECREADAPRGCTDDPGEFDKYGNLAHAYEVGYSCNSERELRQYWQR